MADEMSSYFRRMRSVREEQGLLTHHSGKKMKTMKTKYAFFSRFQKNYKKKAYFISTSEQECYTHMLSVLTSQMQYIDQ